MKRLLLILTLCASIIGCAARVTHPNGTTLEVDTRGQAEGGSNTATGSATADGADDVLVGGADALRSGEREWNQWLRSALAASNARVRAAMKARDDVARRAADAFAGVE